MGTPAGAFYRGVRQDEINHDEQMTDALRSQKVTQYKAVADNIQKILSSGIDPHTQQKLTDEQLGHLNTAYSTVNSAMEKLYNPSVNPATGMKPEDPIHKLTDKLHLTTAPDQKPAGQQLADIKEIQAKYASEPEVNPMLKKQREMKEAGYTDEMIASGREVETGIKAKPTAYKPAWKEYRLPDPVTGMPGKNTQWYDLNDPESIPKGAIAVTPGDGRSTAPKVGSLGEFLTQAYGDNPTADQILEGKRKWTEASAGTTQGSHFITVPQPDGTIKVFQVETTSTKTFPGHAPTVEPPAPAGGKAPTRVPTKQASAPGATKPAEKSTKLKSGDVVGGRMTPAQTAAQKEYDDAVALASTADQVAKKPDDAVNQKRLAVALERAAAGRFTTQALDYVIRAGWGNTIEQWANNVSTGSLPEDVMRQLIDGAHELVTAKAEALRASGVKLPGSDTGKGGGNTRVSLKAAMAKPFNKGKSKEEVKADIEKHGHQVIDDTTGQ